jgi:NAD(P)-dependent dehydrogenase (short-subunit alcohol dehydrogenase family)
MPRVLFITGANRGFGHSLAQTFLSAGEFVAATARDPTLLSFTDTTPEKYLPLKLDVTCRTDINSALASTLNKFGRIDIVVNNAAFGLMGVLERLSDAQLRSQFETNFFSAAIITREAVRIMRKQTPSGGLIIQMSSVCGLLSMPMMGGYCASKHALEALTDAVRQEMKPDWGIRLLSMQPGHMETEAHTRSMEYGELNAQAYDHLDAEGFVNDVNKMKREDTMIIARKMYELSKKEDLPSRILIGSDALAAMKYRVERDQETLDKAEYHRYLKTIL